MQRIERLIYVIFLLCACQEPVEHTIPEELPDDYLPLSFDRIDGRLTGDSEYLEGFSFSIDAPGSLLNGELSEDGLFEVIREQNLTGVLTYPNGRTTPIAFEIVRHRGPEEIYMKSSLGYFLWEYLVVKKNEVSFAIYWWYHPPATEDDLLIIQMAEGFLEDPANWRQNDDRQCEDDSTSGQWSLFCALKHATMEITGEYNHHGTAIQSARFAIDELVPDHDFAHALMDYNNAPSIGHQDIMRVLEMARHAIESALEMKIGCNVANDSSTHCS